jgi:hypothetical protein
MEPERDLKVCVPATANGRQSSRLRGVLVSFVDRYRIIAHARLTDVSHRIWAICIKGMALLLQAEKI